jgi:hypothetical protein
VYQKDKKDRLMLYTVYEVSTRRLPMHGTACGKAVSSVIAAQFAGLCNFKFVLTVWAVAPAMGTASGW